MHGLVGTHQNEETRMKRSLSLKGRKRSQKTKDKISRSMKGKKPWNTGLTCEKQPAWKGGISELYNKYEGKFGFDLREDIRKRDGYRCQFCSVHQDDIEKLSLDVHHIDYNPKNNDLNNLISLCRACHRKNHINRNRINYLKEVLLNES